MNLFLLNVVRLNYWHLWPLTRTHQNIYWLEENENGLSWWMSGVAWTSMRTNNNNIDDDEGSIWTQQFDSRCLSFAELIEKNNFYCIIFSICHHFVVECFRYKSINSINLVQLSATCWRGVMRWLATRNYRQHCVALVNSCWVENCYWWSFSRV